MKTLGKIALGIFLVGLGLVVAGLIAGGTGAFGETTPDDFTLVDETYEVGTIEDVVLDFANKSITVVPSDTAEIRIIYYVSEDNPVTVTEEATAITFEEEPDWSIHWFNFNWFWPVSQEYYACTLYLPAGIAFDLDFSTTNGAVEISDLADLLEIGVYTSNGAVDLTGLAVAGMITVQSTNGALDATDVNATGAVSLRTSNGRITVTNLTAGGDVTLRTSNGQVHVTGLSASDLEVDSSNGDIDVSIVGSYDDYRILISTSNGSMYIDGVKKNDGSYNPSLSDTIDIHTSNGTINLDFE